MKIVLYINSCLPGIGGREIVVHYLAEAFQELGHHVRIVGPAGFWSQRHIRFNYPLHRFPTLLGGAFTDHEAACKLLLDTALWGCDVIHAHNASVCGYPAARLKSLKNLPLVITPHGEDIHMIPEIGFGERLDSAKRHKITYALQKAELVTAISNSVEASLLEAGALPAKIRKIPNGIDVKRFRRTVGADPRKWLRLGEDARLIVSVGNHHPRKGQEIMLSAMPLILAGEPRARLVMVGRNQEPLKSMIDDLGLQDKVRLTGVIPFPLNSNGRLDIASGPAGPDRLASIYQNSEIYVSSGISEGAEGLSLALLDAMAAGLPVVASNISGNRDVVQHGQSGFLVPPSDPAQLAEGVLRLLKTDALRRSMRKESARIADNYQWSRIAQQYLDVYREARKRRNSALFC